MWSARVLGHLTPLFETFGPYLRYGCWHLTYGIESALCLSVYVSWQRPSHYSLYVLPQVFESCRARDNRIGMRVRERKAQNEG